jgi:hypothetical protein
LGNWSSPYSASIILDTTAPAVSAGSNQTKGAAFTQTATATDANAMTYGWTKQTGPGTITFGTLNALSTTITASIDGSYTIRFTATDAAGNSSYSDMTLVWDTSKPTVAISTPSATPTKSGPVTYTLTYTGADSITLAPANVTLNKTGTANGTVVVSGTGNMSRTVTVSNIAGDGTLGISIVSGTASDNAGNVASAAGPSSTFTVDNTAPTAAIGAPSATLAKSGPVTYTITYTGADSINLAAANVTLIKTGTANGTVAVNGTGNTTRTVTVSNITGDGTLGISIAAGTASDSAGNLASAAGPASAFAVDNTLPTVSAGTNQAKGTAFTQTGTATDTSGLIYGWSQVSGPGTVNFGSPDAISTEISASTNGVYVIRFTVTDAAGNVSYSEMTLTWDATAPSAIIGAPSTAMTKVGPVSYTVTYAGADSITLSPASVTLIKTGTANGTVSVSGAGSTMRIVTISSITGDGTLGISITAGTAIDTAENPATAPEPSATFVVDNTPPVVSAGDNQTKGIAFTQTGTAIDANALTYSWTKQSGPGSVNFGTADALSTTISATEDGTYTIRLTATDAAGNSSFGEMTLIWDATVPVTTANPAGGSYGLPQTVTLSANEPATIYYTTDGSDPTEASNVYNAPIAITATTTLKFFAKDSAGNAEPAKTQTYVIDKGLNGIQGDINGDGIVSLADAIVALQVMADLHPQSLRTDYALSNADVNRDGRVGMAEVILILQKTTELRQ